jgi:hypothetical protein
MQACTKAYIGRRILIVDAKTACFGLLVIAQTNSCVHGVKTHAYSQGFMPFPEKLEAHMNTRTETLCVPVLHPAIHPMIRLLIDSFICAGGVVSGESIVRTIVLSSLVHFEAHQTEYENISKASKDFHLNTWFSDITVFHNSTIEAFLEHEQFREPRFKEELSIWFRATTQEYYLEIAYTWYLYVHQAAKILDMQDIGIDLQWSLEKFSLNETIIYRVKEHGFSVRWLQCSIFSQLTQESSQRVLDTTDVFMVYHIDRDCAGNVLAVYQDSQMEKNCSQSKQS